MSSRVSLQHFVSTTEPTGVTVGDEWYNSSTGILYKRIASSLGVQWVNISGSDYFALPVGTSTQRPINPLNGFMRFNTSTGSGEIYNSSSGQWLTFGIIPNLNVEYLVIGGGGSGGTSGASANESGGGAGGGFLTGNITASTLTPYAVTVGAGGNASNGSDSIFSSTTSAGGGRGASNGSTGFNGASGGGGTHSGTAGGKGIYPGSSYISATRQGYDGGNGASSAGGGGGGAGAAGSNASTSAGGAGGVGLQSSISGTSTYYAGGGGGGAPTPGTGTVSTGGGGNGINGTVGNPGTPNTGGGGGGIVSGSIINGGNGGSGIVILKYLSSYTATFSGGLTSSTVTSGVNKISTITNGTGTVTFS
jgi:hypothetical protein